MFDLLKGAGMLLVVLVHSISWNVQDQLGWKVVYSLLMPVFFVTSGFWLRKMDFRSGVSVSARFVLKPYLITVLAIEIIGLGHRMATNDLTDWVKTFLVPGILGRSGENSRFGPLWFLLALFWAWCLFYMIMLLEKERVQIVCAAACGIAGGILLPYKLPFQAAQGLIAAFFVYAGYWMKRNRIFEKKLSAAAAAGLAVLWGITVLFGSMDLGMYDVKYGFLSIAGSTAGVLLLIRIFLYMNTFENPVFDILEQTGRYTMWILCVHALEGAVVPWELFRRYMPHAMWGGALCWFLMRSVLIGVMCAGMLRLQKIWARRVR